MQLEQLTPVLQLAVSPVILISGVGLLLLSMTNRFGRVVDRVRAHADGLRHTTGDDHARLAQQLEILGSRSRLIQSAIWFAGISVLFAAVMIITLFTVALVHLEAAILLVILFVACLLSLIVSLCFFLTDINFSLKALDLEVRSANGELKRK